MENFRGKFFQRDFTCWTISLLLGSLLFLWRGELFSPLVKVGSALVDIDFVLEDETAGFAGAIEPQKESKTFLSKLRDLVRIPKKENIDTGKISPRMETGKAPKMIDKGRYHKADFASVNLSGQNQKLAADTLNKEIALTDSSKKLTSTAPRFKDKGYQIAKKDLPFSVGSSADDSLATENVGYIPVGKVTTQPKGVSGETQVFRDKGNRPVKISGAAPVGGATTSKTGLSGVSDGSAIGGEISERSSGAGYTQGRADWGGTSGQNNAGSGGGYRGKGNYSGYWSGGETGNVNIGPSSGGSGGEKQIIASSKSSAPQRTIFQITGPLASRRIIHQVIPSYPEWAEKQGIIAEVGLYFVVFSDGRVKDNIIIKRSSGYPRLDILALNALKQWKFSSLEEKRYGEEQWGIITFSYKLK